MLLELPRLQVLSLTVNEGALPPQLGALTELQEIRIRVIGCLTGTLPTNYGRHWPSLSTLEILPLDVTQRTIGKPSCGIHGPLPQQWGQFMTNVRQLVLPFGRLSGSLPESWAGMRRLETLNLKSNLLTGDACLQARVVRIVTFTLS